MPGSIDDVTALLHSFSCGDQDARQELFSVVYGRLHELAHAAMRRERPDHTLQTTALVHEAYLRMVGSRDDRWQNRRHFFAIAATAMRRILIDEARRRRAVRRGGDHREGAAADPDAAGVEDRKLEELEALDRALRRLEAHPEHARKCTVVELRFFVGLTLEQTAEVLGISIATVKRDWEYTRAWLGRELSAGRPGATGDGERRLQQD